MNPDDSGGRRRIHLREISGDSETPLETVGQDLRAARLRRGDDLATVSRSLKIRKDHLEAVEEDNFAALPGKTYAIGFVRSYSGYLGLDSAKTVERYKQEISGRHDEHQPPDAHNFHAEESRRLPYGWRIVAGIIILALVYGVWHLWSGGPTSQPVPPPPALSPPHPQVVAAKPPPAPSSPQPAPATGNSAEPPPASSGSVNISPPPAAPAPAPSAPKSASMTSGAMAAAPTRDTAQPSPAVPAVANAGPSGPGEVYGRLNVNPRVVLHTRADTRLTVRGPDGTIYLNRDLRAGDSYQVPNIPGLSLATNDAGAVDVQVDGRDLGKAGQSQQILGRVSLDPASLEGRFNSH